MAASLTVVPVAVRRPRPTPRSAGTLAERRPASRPTRSSRSPVGVQPDRRCWSSGQNNVTVWTRTVDRAGRRRRPRSARITIEIVEPKVPLVRSGSMDLKVVAERKPGFKAPIAVCLPWNPPGVGSAGGVAIPEGQNEAVIPMNADGGAELRTWKIVVTARSGVGQRADHGSRRSSRTSTVAAAVRRPRPSRSASVEQGKETDMAVKVDQGRRLPRRGQGDARRPADKVTTDAEEDHQGHHRARLPHQDRHGLAGRQPHEPVLPGGRHAERRADRAQHRHRRSCGSTCRCRPSQRPAGAAASRRRRRKPRRPPPAKPLSRLEKLRLEQASRRPARQSATE